MDDSGWLGGEDGEDDDKGGDDSRWLGGKAGCNWWDSRRLGWRGFELLRLTTASSIMCVLVGAALYQGVPKPLLIVSMLRILWMFTCTTFLRQPVLPLIDHQVHFTSDCLASLSNLDDLVQTYLSYTKYTFWLWLPRCIVKVGRRPTRPQLVPMNIPLSLSQATCSSHHYTIYISHTIHTQYTHHAQCICMDSGYCKLRRMKVVFIIVTGCDTKASRTF